MNRIITLPPIETFDDGELKEPKKLALKTLEESAELVEAVKSDDREHIIEELGDVIQPDVGRTKPKSSSILRRLRNLL